MQPPCGKYGLTLTDNGEISAPYETVPNPQSHEVWRISTRRDRNQPAARLPQSRALRENPAILRVLSVNPGGGEYWSQGKWRREWDSNPRYGFPHTRFPSVRLKPLGHLSGPLLIGGVPVFARDKREGLWRRDFPGNILCSPPSRAAAGDLPQVRHPLARRKGRADGTCAGRTEKGLTARSW